VTKEPCGINGRPGTADLVKRCNEQYSSPRGGLIKMVSARLIGIITFLLAMLFTPAGTTHEDERIRSGTRIDLQNLISLLSPRLPAPRPRETT